MYDLEYYIYHGGYGPTNETLGKFIRELFEQTDPRASGRGQAQPRPPFLKNPPGSSNAPNE